MPAVFERLTLDEFRDKYADENPYWEYWNGTAVRKSLPIVIALSINALHWAIVYKCCDRATPK